MSAGAPWLPSPPYWRSSGAALSRALTCAFRLRPPSSATLASNIGGSSFTGCTTVGTCSTAAHGSCTNRRGSLRTFICGGASWSRAARSLEGADVLGDAGAYFDVEAGLARHLEEAAALVRLPLRLAVDAHLAAA